MAGRHTCGCKAMDASHRGAGAVLLSLPLASLFQPVLPIVLSRPLS